MAKINLAAASKAVLKRARLPGVLTATALLAACATNPSALDAAAPSTPAQPVEAAPRANPNFPGISSIIFQFQDNTKRQCWVDRDKAAQVTPDGVGSQVFQLRDGGYAVQVGSASAGVNSVRINGNNVFGTNSDGTVGKLSAEQASPFVQTLTSLRGNCEAMLQDTQKNLLPTGLLQPGRPLVLGNQTPLRAVLAVPAGAS